MNDLKLQLQKRKYPLNLIDDEIKQALKQQRSILLQTNKRETNDVLAFISTYNPIKALKELMYSLHCVVLRSMFYSLIRLKMKYNVKSLALSIKVL